MVRATLCALALLAASGAALAQSCNRNEDDGDHLHPRGFCDDDVSRQLAQFKDFPAEPAARLPPVLPQRLAGADAAASAAWMEEIRRDDKLALISKREKSPYDKPTKRAR